MVIFDSYVGLPEGNLHDVKVGELTPEVIHAFDAVVQHTHGAPSHHNDFVVANVMQLLGWASQAIVGTGRLRIPYHHRANSPLRSHHMHILTARSSIKPSVCPQHTQITRHSILNQDRIVASLPTQALQAAIRQTQKAEAMKDGAVAAQYVHKVDGAMLDYVATYILPYLVTFFESLLSVCI